MNRINGQFFWRAWIELASGIQRMAVSLSAQKFLELALSNKYDFPSLDRRRIGVPEYIRTSRGDASPAWPKVYVRLRTGLMRAELTAASAVEDAANWQGYGTSRNPVREALLQLARDGGRRGSSRASTIRRPRLTLAEYQRTSATSKAGTGSRMAAEARHVEPCAPRMSQGSRDFHATLVAAERAGHGARRWEANRGIRTFALFETCAPCPHCSRCSSGRCAACRANALRALIPMPVHIILMAITMRRSCARCTKREAYALRMARALDLHRMAAAPCLRPAFRYGSPALKSV